MLFCLRKTLTRGIKTIILEYAMSSVKFPPHLHNATEIKEQLPVPASRLLGPRATRCCLGHREGSQQGCSCPSEPLQLTPSPPRVVNAALALPAGGVTPLQKSLAGWRAAAEVLQGVAQLRNQPRLCNDSLPPPAN